VTPQHGELRRISAGRLLALARASKMPVARFFEGAPEE
jgi:hypothetical protein